MTDPDHAGWDLPTYIAASLANFLGLVHDAKGPVVLTPTHVAERRAAEQKASAAGRRWRKRRKQREG